MPSAARKTIPNGAPLQARCPRRQSPFGNRAVVMGVRCWTNKWTTGGMIDRGRAAPAKAAGRGAGVRPCQPDIR